MRRTKSIEDVKASYKRGELTDATHMIIFRSGYTDDCYPVYIHPGEEVWEALRASQDAPDEIYKYSLGWESQEAEDRSWNL